MSSQETPRPHLEAGNQLCPIWVCKYKDSCRGALPVLPPPAGRQLHRGRGLFGFYCLFCHFTVGAPNGLSGKGIPGAGEELRPSQRGCRPRGKGAATGQSLNAACLSQAKIVGMPGPPLPRERRMPRRPLKRGSLDTLPDDEAFFADESRKPSGSMKAPSLGGRFFETIFGIARMPREKVRRGQLGRDPGASISTECSRPFQRWVGATSL